MRRIQYSILTLLGVTAVVAIAIVSLRTGDWFWCRILFTLTLALNLGAVLGAIFLRGRRRAFWIGFALFGWACWVIVNTSYLRIAEHQFFARELYSMIREYAPEGNDGIVVSTGNGRIAVFSFRQIVHAMLSLLFSVFGGVIGCWLRPLSWRDQTDTG